MFISLSLVQTLCPQRQNCHWLHCNWEILGRKGKVKCNLVILPLCRCLETAQRDTKSFATLRSGLDMDKGCNGVSYNRLVFHSTPWHVIYSTAFHCTAIAKSVVDLLILFTLLWLCSICLCHCSPFLLQLCNITARFRKNESWSWVLFLQLRCEQPIQ